MKALQWYSTGTPIKTELACYLERETSLVNAVAPQSSQRRFCPLQR
ncbi:MAG: hypothetical protein L0Z71_08530 [Anaerolineae bacterium]|nr:hypothetical protein [Anaerolineae bacterium]